jgi:hypothetical protein
MDLYDVTEAAVYFLFLAGVIYSVYSRYSNEKEKVERARYNSLVFYSWAILLKLSLISHYNSISK